MNRFVLACALVAASLSPFDVAAAAERQPYAGMQERPVKALSDQQIADLRAGRGMGYALAAELNGYPGPTHVLDLADQLALSDEQRDRVSALLASMKSDTVPLGERLIEQEAGLDRAFRDGYATPEGLDAATRVIGHTQAELRAKHLSYHLTTAAALTPHQLRRYQELRGYESPSAGEQGRRGHGAGHGN